MINRNNKRLFEQQMRLYAEEFTFDNMIYKAIIRKHDKKIIVPYDFEIKLYDTIYINDLPYIITSRKNVDNIYKVFEYELVLNYLTFKLKDNTIINYPCIVKDVSATLSYSEVISLTGNVEVRIKRDDLTKLIETNDRFFIYDYVYKVIQVSWAEEGCYIISLEMDSIHSTDDKVNRTTDAIYDYTLPVIPTWKTFTLSYGDNGVVTSSHIGTILTGTEITLTFTPNNDYKVDTFTLNNIPINLISNTYTFTLTDDTTANVTFIQTINRYNVTCNCDTNGTLTIDKTSPIDEGKDVTFTYTPLDGYELDTFTINGVAQTMTNNTYTMIVDKDINAIATSKQKIIEILVAPSGSYGNGGTVSSTSEVYDYSIRKGNTAQFTFTVDGKADNISITRTDNLANTKATVTITNNIIEIKALAESVKTLLSFNVVYGSTIKEFKIKLNALW